MKKMFIIGIMVVSLIFIGGSTYSFAGSDKVQVHHNTVGDVLSNNNTAFNGGTVDNSIDRSITNIDRSITDKSRTGVFDNVVKNNKTGIFDNTVKIQDNLNDNQVGLINQKGAGNQQGLVNTNGDGNQVGLVNTKGSDNMTVIGGKGGGDYYNEGSGDAQAQKQAQGQLQGQAQGQLQGQAQEANNEGVSLSVTQNYEAKRDHLQGPEIVTPDAKFSEGKRFESKTKGSVWDKVDHLTDMQAKKLASDASDVEVEVAVIFERDFQLKNIDKGISGDYMGTITLFPDGSDVTVGGMEGKAAVAAMKLGATHMHRIYFGSGDNANGGSWNIGLGGGASIMRSGDDVAIAPNGGLGYGKAKASNDTLPEMVFELYSNEDIIKEFKGVSYTQTGNHTRYGSVQ